MGSTTSEITQSEFNKYWKATDKRDNFTLWENRDDMNHKLQQYSVSWDDTPQSQEFYQLRRNSPHLVNAYDLRQDSAGCGTDNLKHLFLQRIPLRLSNVEDIPFPDTLHLYDAAINGYRQLSTVCGSFRIDEDQMGINERGQLKVWCNTNLEINGFLRHQSYAEPAMVRDLLEILNQNCDNSSYPAGVPPLHNHLIAPSVPLFFNQLQDRYVDYLRRYTNGEVPTAMACVFEAGGARSINSWCRTHQSYGFYGPDTRLSESVYQSKLVRNSMLTSTNISPSHYVPTPYQTTIGNRASAGYQPSTNFKLLPQQQTHLTTVNPAPTPPTFEPVRTTIPPYNTKPSLAEGPSSLTISAPPAPISPKNRPLPSISEHPDENMSSVKRDFGQRSSFPLVRQDERQSSLPLMNKGGYNSQTSYHPPQQANFQPTPGYNRTVEKYPPQFIQAALKIPQHAAPSPQHSNLIINQPSQVGSNTSQQRPHEIPKIVAHPQDHKITIVQSNQAQTPRTVLPAPQPAGITPSQPNQDPTKNPVPIDYSSPIAMVSQTSPKAQPVRSVFAQSNAQPVRVDASGSNFLNRDALSSSDFSNSNVNMQHERVFSQKYEVKEDIKPISGMRGPSYETTYQATTTSPVRTPGEELSNYGRGVDYSHSINEGKVVAHEDGQSSPEFLALMSQLRGNINKGSTGQIYSEVADTPATYKHDTDFSYSGKRANISPGADAFAQSTTSAYDTGLAYKADEGSDYYSKYIAQLASGSGPESGSYSYSRYESNIDPQLQADLKKYQ